jgi:hypothetical protein
MTYLVEVTNEHTVDVLRSLEKAGLLTVRAEPKSGKQRAVTREQQTNRILNSVREGLEQVARPAKTNPTDNG